MFNGPQLWVMLQLNIFVSFIRLLYIFEYFHLKVSYLFVGILIYKILSFRNYILIMFINIKFNHIIYYDVPAI